MSIELENNSNEFYTKDKFNNDLHEAKDEYSKKLDLIKASIRNVDNKEEIINLKSEMLNLKENLKINKKNLKYNYQLYLRPIKNKDLLMSSNGMHYENKFKNLSREKILFFKKQLKQFKKNNKFIKTSNKYENLINKLNYKIELSKIKENYSYDAILNTKVLYEKKKYIVEKYKLNNDYKKNLVKEEENFNNIVKSSKKEVQPLLRENFKNYVNKIKKLIKQIMFFKINKDKFVEEFLLLKKDYIERKNELINNNRYYLAKMNLKYVKNFYKKRKKELKFTLNSNIDHYANQTPIIWAKWKKWIATFLAFILPGLGQLFSREYKKAIVFLCITPIFILMTLYAFGIGNIEGKGILGLISLGAAESLWETKDARYFVIEGSLAVIFLSMVISYCVYSALSTLKRNLILEQGSRTNSWLETKNFIVNSGYPILTSIPCILSLIFISFIPIITSILLAFTNYGPNNSTNFKWSGLEQFRILFDKDWSRTLIYVMWWSLLWTFFSWFTSFIIAYILATITNNPRIKGKKIVRMIYILPWAVPAFISILVFRLMTIPGGLISNWLGTEAIQSNITYARMAILFIQMWMGYCVNYVLITGILQSINKDLYEAVEIDGGGVWQKTFKITLPIVIYQMTPILIGQLIGGFNNFTIIYLYLDGGPYLTDLNLAGSAGATDTISSLIYKLISGGHVGKASALNIIVSFVIVTISISVLLKSKSIKGGQN